ncbi:MAG: type 2 isopentenyl-diphosphate Delta-isomerase [Mycobacterium leprae]
MARPERGVAAPGWEEVGLVHQSLPELALHQIDLSTSLAGIHLPNPVIINAMTGGAPAVAAINRDLSAVAAELNMAMAVGSQTAGLKESEVAGTYRVVREVNPDGVIIANLSADATLETAKRAVDMVEADLLQIHLNAPQELVMAEGDRDFRGQLKRIEQLVRNLPVGVIVKETGFGLAREAVRTLYAVGVRAVDVSGRGGTNFAWIESERRGQEIDPGLLEWGNPTAACLAEVAALGYPDLDIIASGGIARGSQVAKALCLGAKAAGLAGAVLTRHQDGGRDAVRQYLLGVLRDLSTAMLLTGAQNLTALQTKPVIITGSTGEWCKLRGVDLNRLACRSGAC